MRSKNDVECIADVAKNVREKIIIETKKNDSFQRKEKKKAFMIVPDFTQ